jgi:hypothetical protein
MKDTVAGAFIVALIIAATYAALIMGHALQ